ncbi:patatin-like phospholipase family protein [Congregibacter sp.]|uniref:patatin-like phospholipase family protein n=1 Tax=Congregibacter sp. TaxID=2744308 RepID=UPI003F6BDBCC
MKNALILSGGGARAAYQVGVLKAIAELLPVGAKNPFSVVCGTSAGAINAVTVAAHDGSFAEAVNILESVWMGLTPDDVYRSGWGAMARSGGRLALSLVNRGVGVGKPVALLDNSPLRDLIKGTINFEKIDRAIARGDLDAVCVTATGYQSARSMCFYQANADISDWSRYRRSGRRTLLNVDHLMASSAIPTMFPATRIEYEYFGDGAVRQLAPLSPALHLGAHRLFIVGVSANRERHPADSVPRTSAAHSPSLAQIIGHLLNSAFIDSLESDIERLDRINNLLASLPPDTQGGASKLRFIERQVISPSEELDVIAAKNIDALHPSVRFLLRATGGTESGAGSTAASYLLFAKPFVESLIALGYRDAMWKRDDIAGFLGVPGE